ncbi:tyrosine-type recombinase/integrase [Streptomyces sp. cg36]|uniref:tyrosine-type recombinase/integrase n=1 Tax=Streptomyces sp. cg36 TaxID=3238798 RepID=UPI0034E1BAD9
MTETSDASRDLAGLVVPSAGSVVESDDPWQPCRLLDADGEVVVPVAEYLQDLQAIGRPATTQRSYALALLRWFRFLSAVGVPWGQATRVEARDFSRWLQMVAKPTRGGAAPQGRVNPVTGKSGPGRQYALRTRAHSETVLRGIYAFHLELGTGPLSNPFPLARGRDGERARAHHAPTAPMKFERSGLYRPKIARQTPRRIPDDRFDELFARLPSHRDRALVTLWLSTGARASELLGVRQGEVDAGQQLVTVVRKGSRVLQSLPASPDAVVWLRLYQAQMDGLVETEADSPLWWTLRRPFRPLSYPAAYRMFQRVNATTRAWPRPNGCPV